MASRQSRGSRPRSLSPRPRATIFASTYNSPWPLSEKYYLVAYSPVPLAWEPQANPANALGIYLLDRFGNRELIYRDLEIGSSNPCPLGSWSLLPQVA